MIFYLFMLAMHLISELIHVSRTTKDLTPITVTFLLCTFIISVSVPLALGLAYTVVFILGSVFEIKIYRTVYLLILTGAIGELLWKLP